MPISGGIWTNWSINSTGGLTGIIQTVSTNIPFFFPLFLIMMYVALYLILILEPGRKKFVPITIVPMIMSYALANYGFLSIEYPVFTTFIAALAIFFVYMTS